MFKLIQQSGVIPYRIQGEKVEILLITTSNRKHWSIPKGWVEPFMSSANSAAKEAYEEAGILGTVITPAIGRYECKKWGISFSVEVFLMHVDVVLDDWAEASKRQREWLNISHAIQRVERTDLKQLLQHCENHDLSSSKVVRDVL